MAEVEDVGAAFQGGDDLAHAVLHAGAAGDEAHRIEIALHRHAFGQHLVDALQRNGCVEAHCVHACPLCIIQHQHACAAREAEDRLFDAQGAHPLYELRCGSDHPAIEGVFGQAFGPAFEQHQRIRAGVGLHLEVVGGSFDQVVEHAVEFLRMLVAEFPAVSLVGAAAAFDGVDADRPGRSAETDQRGGIVEGRADTFDRFTDRREMREDLVHRHVGEIAGFRRGIDARTFAFEEADIASHRIEDQQDVSEEDCAVHSISAHRLQGGLGGECGRVAEVEEVARLCPGLAIFGQMSPCLTHHPYGNGINPFAVEHSKQSSVVQASPGCGGSKKSLLMNLNLEDSGGV